MERAKQQPVDHRSGYPDAQGDPNDLTEGLSARRLHQPRDEDAGERPVGLEQRHDDVDQRLQCASNASPPRIGNNT